MCCRRRPSEEKIKAATCRNLFPENIPNLATLSMNPEVWELLNRGQQVADTATQRIQSFLAHGISAVIKIISAIGTDEGGSTETHLQSLTDANCFLTMSFTTLSQVRKELIRNSLGFPLTKL